jgi:aminomethyltransferase
MGEIEIAGADALEAVQHITSNDASRLADGQIQYSALTTPQGTFVDDVLTYRPGGRSLHARRQRLNIVKDFTGSRRHVKEAAATRGREHRARATR